MLPELFETGANVGDLFAVAGTLHAITRDCRGLRRASIVCFLCALLLMTVTLAACNTVAGFGQDMRATGNAISNAAK